MLNYIKFKFIIIIIIVLIIGIVLGFGLGKNQGIKLGTEQAKKELEIKIAEFNRAIDILIPSLPEEIYQLLGKIKDIEGNVISLETVSLTERTLPGTEPKKEIRKVTVTDNTEIVKFDFNELPADFKETKIKQSDLKTGDQITATASENIKDKPEFTASRIQIQIYPTP